MEKNIVLYLLSLCLVFQMACTGMYGPPAGPKDGKQYDALIEKGQTRYNQRNHRQAIALFDASGDIRPHHSQWRVGKARALFAMGRFDAAARTCEKALFIDDKAYDAVALYWTARLQADYGSDTVRSAVRAEIEAVEKSAGDDIDALTAAFTGYSRLKDDPAQRRLILELAGRAAEAEPAAREQIGAALFEQIIAARKAPDAQRRLMRAYIRHFPDRRFADFIALRRLTKKWTDDEAPTDPIAFARRTLSSNRTHWRIKVGVARWLIEEEKQPEKAVRLLEDALAERKAESREKPEHFTPGLWKHVLAKRRDQLRYLKGRALLQAGRLEKAKDELSRVAENKRPWGGVQHDLGVVAKKQDRFEAAIEHFRRSLAIEPKAESRRLLTAMLERHHDYSGDPADFFAARNQNGAGFSDVTESAGLSGVDARRVAWGDYNNDGFPDLLFDGARLFENTGDGGFTEVTGAVGIGGLSRTTGGIWGDYDNDGDLDIFVTCRNRNRLLENRGGQTFVDVTDTAFQHMPPARTEAAAWGDLDGDGFLDIYVANYEKPGVMRAVGTPDRLYRNRGNGTFADISETASIRTDEAMCGRGVTWTDVDGDGQQDIVVANYRLDPNFLWHNRGGGRVTEEGGKFGVRGQMTAGYFGHSIGPASGDLDNDGRFDLFVTNLAHPRYIEFSDQNMLLINQGPPDPHFKNRYSQSGIAFEETNADPAIADVDNDGDIDLYTTSTYSGRHSHLYLNDGAGRFTDGTWLSKTRVENGWGAAFADFNRDGFADLVVAGEDGVRLFANKTNANHWVQVAIEDRQCNRFGIGSRIEIRYDGRRQVREIHAGHGTGSQNAPVAHFGLGNHTGPVTIHATTACGEHMQRRIPTPDQRIILTN
ncbi:MAG: FG-GAP-like repeat-containing protein [Thermodesulfobacteriota bacterium]